MPVRLNSSGGGSVTLDVPVTAGTFTLNLPAANGDLVGTGGGSTVQFGAGSAAAPSITTSGDTNTGMFFPAADTIAFAEGGVEAMRIDSSGNVGIGTTTPNFSGYGTTNLTISGGTTIQGVLELVGTRVDGAGFAAGDINFFANSNSAGNKRIAAIQVLTDGVTANNRGGAIVFNAKADNGALAERARITPTGALVVGTTTNASYTADRIQFNSGSGYYVLNQSSVGVVLPNGNTSWSAQSDERLKDIIEPIENAASKVASLRSIIGRYKTDEPTKRRAFLIAQDVQAVLPEAVTEDDQGYLLLAYTELVPLLTAALQEALTEIASLKARVAVLEAR